MLKAVKNFDFSFGRNKGIETSGTLKTEKFTVHNGVVKTVARQGNVVVDVSKIEQFARGKSKPFTSELQRELADLKTLRQAKGKGFNADPNNQVRLKELSALERNFSALLN